MLKVKISKCIWCRCCCVGRAAGMSSVRRNQGLPHAGPSCFQMALNQTHCRTQSSPFPVPASPHLWVWADLSGVHEWGGVCLGGRKDDVLIFVSALTSWVYLPQTNLVWPWWCCKWYACLFLNPVGFSFLLLSSFSSPILLRRQSKRAARWVFNS